MKKNKIRAFREKYKLTPKQLSKILQKSERTVRAYESGYRNYTKDVLYRLEIYEEKQLAIDSYAKEYKNKMEKDDVTD